MVKTTAPILTRTPEKSGRFLRVPLTENLQRRIEHVREVAATKGLQLPIEQLLLAELTRLLERAESELETR